LALSGCGSGAAQPYELPSEKAIRYSTAYIAVVVADPPGEDLERGAGEHVVLRTNWDHRTDMGSWSVVDTDGNRLLVGIGTQIDPDAEVRL
jgi:hypothetical protein